MVCLGCSAQSAPPELAHLVERHVRAYYSLPPDIKVNVGAPHASDIPNFDAMTVTMDNGSKRQDYEFLVSKDHKTLMRVTRMDLTKDPYVETMKKISVEGRPTRGNKDAKVVVINFDDFECPFCSRMHETLFPALFKEYGDRVLFIYKDYPLEEIHPWAIHAAVDANCLAAQNTDAFWDFADYIHANQRLINAEKVKDREIAAVDKVATLQGQRHNVDDAKLQACIKQQDEKPVRASMKEGDVLGVNATPTLFVNGQKLDGAVPIEEMRATLDHALQEAGVPVPDHKSTAAGNKLTENSSK
jgi:protein-disulfide isomerase